jgi:hypothetical protein
MSMSAESWSSQTFSARTRIGQQRFRHQHLQSQIIGYTVQARQRPTRSQTLGQRRWSGLRRSYQQLHPVAIYKLHADLRRPGINQDVVHGSDCYRCFKVCLLTAGI